MNHLLAIELLMAKLRIIESKIDILLYTENEKEFIETKIKAEIIHYENAQSEFEEMLLSEAETSHDPSDQESFEAPNEKSDADDN